MTRERHLLGHLIFQTNEGDVAVASKQRGFMDCLSNLRDQFRSFQGLLNGNFDALLIVTKQISKLKSVVKLKKTESERKTKNLQN
jgi:hypothetical protein